MDCIWVDSKNVGSLSLYIQLSFTELENHSQLLCGLDIANERLLV